MNTKELVSFISEKTNLPKQTIETVLDEMTKTIVSALKNEDIVKIGGLGVFSAKKKEARKARNPKTGETVDVPAKTVAKFKPAKELKEAF